MLSSSSSSQHTINIRSRGVRGKEDHSHCSHNPHDHPHDQDDHHDHVNCGAGEEKGSQGGQAAFEGRIIVMEEGGAVRVTPLDMFDDIAGKVFLGDWNITGIHEY